MTTYYVSPSGTNGDGLSWATAKTSFFNVHLLTLNPGDIVIGDNATFREDVSFKSGVTYQGRTPAVPAADGRGLATPSLTTISGADLYTQNAAYRWVTTGSGTNEWRLEAAAGGTPGITQPTWLFLDHVRLATGTIGSLADHRWAWGAGGTPVLFDAASSQQLNGTTTWNHALGAASGNNRLLTCWIKIEDSSFVVTGVTFNGVAGTKRVEKNDSTNREHIQLWEWLDAALPASSGTYGFSVTYSGGTPQGFAHGRSYTRVAQSAPVTTSSEAAAASSVSASLTGTAVGALVTTAVGTGDAHDWNPANAALTNVHAVTGTAAAQSLDIATATVGAGGTVDVSWSKAIAGTSNRIVTAAAAYASAAAAFNTVILRDESGDPDTSEVVIEGTQRIYCLQDGGVNGLTNTVFDGINVEKCRDHGYRIWNALTGIVIKNARVRLCGVVGISSRNTNGANWVDGLAIQGCEVSWNNEPGIRILQQVRNWLIERNDVHHNSQADVTFTGGIYVQSSRQNYGGVIRYNNVHNNGRDLAGNDLPHTAQSVGNGIWLDTVDNNADANPSLVYGNYSHHNSGNGLYCENTIGSRWFNNVSSYNSNESGIFVASSDTVFPVQNNIIEHNLFIGNRVNIRGNGDFLDVSAESVIDNIVRNNITSDAVEYEMELFGGAMNNTSGTFSSSGHGNVWWPNAFGPDRATLMNLEEGPFFFNQHDYAGFRTFFGGLSVSDTIEGDPQVADPSNGDWRLRVTSPCRDRAVGSTQTTDFLGGARPQGRTADAGVHELPPPAAGGATGLGI